VIKRITKSLSVNFFSSYYSKKIGLPLNSLKEISEKFERRLFLINPSDIKYRVVGIVNPAVSDFLANCFYLPEWFELLLQNYEPHPSVVWEIKQELISNGVGCIKNDKKTFVETAKMMELDRVRFARYKDEDLTRVRLEQTKRIVKSIKNNDFEYPNARPTNGNPDVPGIAITSSNKAVWISQGDHRLSAFKCLDPDKPIPVKIRGVPREIIAAAIARAKECMVDYLESELIKLNLSPLPNEPPINEKLILAPDLRPGEK